jgi:RNA-binding protein
MTELTSRQRKTLRGMAHGLEPVVLVGKSGLGAAQLTQIDQALGDHELIKIRFLAGKPAPEELDAIVEALHCGVAGSIGHIAILFRVARDPEKRRIRLD